MKFTIQTKQKNYLVGLKYKSIREVLDAIIFYDLLLPFEVVDENEKKLTAEVVSQLTKVGYKFIDKKEVLSHLPFEVQNLMNKYYRNTVVLTDLPKLAVKLLPVNDIKSIKEFYDLWDNKAVPIGKCGTKILFFDCTSGGIYLIAPDFVKDLSKKNLVTNSITDFLKLFRANVR